MNQTVISNNKTLCLFQPFYLEITTGEKITGAILLRPTGLRKLQKKLNFFLHLSTYTSPMQMVAKMVVVCTNGPGKSPMQRPIGGGGSSSLCIETNIHFIPLVIRYCTPDLKPMVKNIFFSCHFSGLKTVAPKQKRCLHIK